MTKPYHSYRTNLTETLIEAAESLALKGLAVTGIDRLVRLRSPQGFTIGWDLDIAVVSTTEDFQLRRSNLDALYASIEIEGRSK